MKFIFADSLDYVDPAFDFIADRSPAERQPYWDDAYPHEILGYAPYDGVLVSKGIVGDHRVKGKYTASQARRFELVGARKFLRLDKPEFAHLDIFGDCGAFTYVNEERPPYSPAEIAEFYDDCGFTHGCSVDHIIFDFDVAAKGLNGGSNDAKDRFEITLENADAFRREAKAIDARFEPLGVVQGWSPDSMAEAARRLVEMGYDYLALGGMVPLKSPEIKQCLAAIREVVPPATRLHILGFAKADDIDSFHSYDIASFDTTSPLIRAFKDAKQNYYLPGNGLGLRYFTSIRVPQALETRAFREWSSAVSFEQKIWSPWKARHCRACARLIGAKPALRKHSRTSSSTARHSWKKSRLKTARTRPAWFASRRAIAILSRANHGSSAVARSANMRLSMSSFSGEAIGTSVAGFTISRSTRIILRDWI